MTILAVGDAVWNALIAGVVTVVLAALTQWNANKAAAKVAEVKDALETKGEQTDDKLDSIHKLVNSALGVQLKRVMVLSRERADLSKDPGAIAEADADQLAYENHMRGPTG